MLNLCRAVGSYHFLFASILTGLMRNILNRVLRIIEASKLQADQCLKSSEIDKKSETSDSLSGQENIQILTQIKGEFDAVIAIGVLIKGETMHFEYISDSVSHGLMRVQLDTGVPIVFGVLTVFSKEQALERSGMYGECRKNHGEDWGFVAVELGVKRKKWKNGEL